MSLTCRKQSANVPSVLELAVENHLNNVVAALCSVLSSETLAQINSTIEARHDGSPCLLWKALISEDWSICDILVKYKCDVDCWHVGACGCLVTLLHRSITESRESAGSYLIAKWVCSLQPLFAAQSFLYILVIFLTLQFICKILSFLFNSNSRKVT